MTAPRLMAVRTEVVLETLVGSFAAAVAERLDDPLEDAVAAALAGDRLARMGYLARALEVERFERARDPLPWLAERLGQGADWSTAAAALASELAAAEPLDRRPDPGDEGAISWRIPGPGGHVRHYVAIRAASDAGRRPGPGAKRSWLAGFLVHCIQEAAPPG